MTEDAAMGAVPVAGTPEPGASGDDGQPNKGDYLGRVRSEPDFAVDQIREKDKLISRLQEQSKRYGPIDPYIERLGGGEGVLELVNQALTVRGNPQLQGIYEHVLGGGQAPSLETKQGYDEDEYVDPEIKALREQVEELRRRDSANQERFASAEVRSFQTGIEKNLERHMQRWAGIPDLEEKATAIIMKSVRNHETLAKGTGQQAEAARQVLQQLSDPEQGLRMLNYMTLDLHDENLEAIAQARQSGAVSRARAHETETPGTTRTAGGAPPPIQKGLPVSQMVRQAVARRSQERGRDPSKLFGL